MYHSYFQIKYLWYNNRTYGTTIKLGTLSHLVGFISAKIR